jgi:hypothetical protein
MCTRPPCHAERVRAGFARTSLSTPTVAMYFVSPLEMQPESRIPHGFAIAQIVNS